MGDILITDLSEAIFWGIPIIASMTTALALGYSAYKDRSKGKIVFAIAFVFNSIGYSSWLLKAAEIRFLDLSYRWAFVPMIAAIHIAAVSSLNRKTTEASLKGFLVVLTTSAVFLLFPLAISEWVFLLFFGTLALISTAFLTLLIAKRRKETSDIMLLMFFLCTIFSVVTKEAGLAAEYSVLLSLFGTIFIGLVFRVADKSDANSLASFILLKEELEKTRENLQLTKERAIRELKASEKRYETLCEEAGFVLIKTNRKGKITFANRRVGDFGLKREEVIGRNLSDFVPKRDWTKLLQETRRVNHGEFVEGEIEVKTPRGIIVGDYRSTPLQRDGRISEVLTSIRDITSKKELEAQHRNYTQELEKKVEERTKAFKLSQEKLERYSQHLEEVIEERTRRLRQSERMAAIGELATMVGHDLRNPLQGIAGATYILKKMATPRLDEKERNMLTTIDHAIEFCNKIINDLLDYSGEIMLDPGETNPQTLLKETLLLVKVPEGIRIIDETRPEPKIRVDAQKMQRVFVNIIKNAFDAMQEGGTLTIRSEHNEHATSFLFRDNGTGISQATMQKLWTPLFTTKAKGMGLGLSICKRIVETHGGKIFVESAKGEGTTFTIVLPIEPAKPAKEFLIDLPETIELKKQ